MEPLASALRQDESIKGLPVPGSKGKEAKVALYMDDVTILCSNNYSIIQALKWTEQFSQAAGAKLNKAKSEIMYINWSEGKIPLCGIILIAVGAVVQVFVDNTVILKDVSAFISPILVISFGIIVFLLAFVSCWSVVKDSVCHLAFFSVLMSFIIIAEITAGILAYQYKGKVIEVLWCKQFAGLESAFPQGNTVPDSCCITETKGCGEGAMTDASKVYQEGCQKILEKALREKVHMVMVTPIAIALLQRLLVANQKACNNICAMFVPFSCSYAQKSLSVNTHS
ncbi:hypothetical protein WMY93_028044 [Mugilogobius chulae]|uniref:Reverse transcriptase domain-containing protein n=1 Tax=Mugilogobius chulae TaxID=88201 RepID=A0AAW0MY71_9GOBI